MRILVPSSSFPANEHDGAGRFVLDLSRALARRGHELLHVCPDRQGRDVTEELGPGLGLRRFSFGPAFCRGLVMGAGIGANIKAAPWRILGLPGLLRNMRRVLEDEAAAFHATHVLSHWVLPSGFAAGSVARARGLRHVTVVHGGALQNLLVLPGGGRLLRSWAEDCDAALYVSEELRRRARQELKSLAPPDAVSPMGVDPERFGPRMERLEARRALGLDPETPVVLGLGRFIRLKGFDLLVRASCDRDDLQLVLAGDGPERRRLERLARRCGVATRFTGQLEPLEIGRYMDAADLLCVPSRLGPGGRGEGCPVVALEALARDLPVVGSASGGLEELLDGREGCRLFPIDDVAALRAILEEFISSGARTRLAGNPAVSEAPIWDYNRLAAKVENLLGVQGGNS